MWGASVIAPHSSTARVVYTDIAAGSDSVVHALWTDTNAQQTIDWWYGYNFNGLLANQQDVVTASANF